MSTDPTTTPASAPPEPPATSAAPRRRRWGCLISLALLVLLLVTAAVAIFLLRSPPAYVQTYQQYLASTTPQERKRAGEELAARVSMTLTPRRLETDGAPLPPLPPGVPDEREIVITVTEANAWLSDVFPEWAAAEKWKLPTELQAPKVGVKGQDILLGFRYSTPSIEQDITFAYRPQLLPDGKLKLELQGVRGGRLPLPLSDMVTGRLHDRAEQNQKSKLYLLAAALAGDPVDPVGKLPMDVSSRARLIRFDMQPDGIKLIFRIEH